MLVVWLGDNVLCFIAYVLLLGWLAGGKAKKRQLKGFRQLHRRAGEHRRGLRPRQAGPARPGLSDHDRAHINVAQIGLRLGEVQGQEVIVGLEDFAAVVAPTGAGKSRDMMVPPRSMRPARSS